LGVGIDEDIREPNEIKRNEALAYLASKTISKFRRFGDW
jgi:hypothetical protein